MKKATLIALLFYLILNNPMLRAQNLVLKLNDASEIQNLLSEIKKLEFSDNNLLITKNTGIAQTYPINDVQKLYFGTIAKINTDIAVHSAISIFPNPTQQFIEVTGIPVSANSIKIFQTDGKLILQENVTETHKTIDISRLNPGLYIINIQNQSLKFYKL